MTDSHQMLSGCGRGRREGVRMLEGQERTWAQDKARRCHVFQCVGDWPLADVEGQVPRTEVR